MKISIRATSRQKADTAGTTQSIKLNQSIKVHQTIKGHQPVSPDQPIHQTSVDLTVANHESRKMCVAKDPIQMLGSSAVEKFNRMPPPTPPKRKKSHRFMREGCNCTHTHGHISWIIWILINGLFL